MDNTNKRAHYYIVPHRMLFGLLGWAAYARWPHGTHGHTMEKVKLDVSKDKQEAIATVREEAEMWYRDLGENAEVHIMNKWGRFTKEGFTVGYDPVESEG